MAPRKPVESAMRFSIPMVVSLLSLMFTLGGGYANYKVVEAEVDRLTIDMREQASTVETMKNAQHVADLRTQHVEDSTRQVMESLGELKADVKDIKTSVERRHK